MTATSELKLTGLFKTFDIHDKSSLASLTQMKSSQARGLRQAIAKQFPAFALNEVVEAKAPLFVAKCNTTPSARLICDDKRLPMFVQLDRIAVVKGVRPDDTPCSSTKKAEKDENEKEEKEMQEEEEEGNEKKEEPTEGTGQENKEGEDKKDSGNGPDDTANDDPKENGENTSAENADEDIANEKENEEEKKEEEEKEEEEEEEEDNSPVLFPTLRLLHRFPDMLPHVQVDKGAIKYVFSSAPIMCPGLTSPGAALPVPINSGRVVAVMVEGKTHAIAVGITALSTESIVSINKGVGVHNTHFLNDGLWTSSKQ